jgi:hypothetical protein
LKASETLSKCREETNRRKSLQFPAASVSSAN